jgi:autotransporter strand-loop-strand O-heptosyltransferase
MFDLALVHTSFLGHTGYNNHAKDFFTSLNKSIKVRIRNYTHTEDLSYLTQEQKNMLIEQKWKEAPWQVGAPFNINDYNNIVNIILNETHHYFFYDDYKKPYIFYNVWESTRQPDEFFKRLLEADQFWVPSHWQKQCTIEQGYPEDRVRVVPEGVDRNIFNPNPVKNPFDVGVFTFFLAGRWDYRKSTKEIIQAFSNEFMKGEPVQLVCSVDNKFATDDMKTTEERLEKYGFTDKRIIVKHFMEFDEYLASLKNCNAFVSCSRSEGWNLPLIEAIACGVPTICSNYGAQLDFAREISSMVDIKEHLPPKEIYFHDIDSLKDGTWAEPDYEHLQSVMRDVYDNHIELRKNALFSSIITGEKFSWENASAIALRHIGELDVSSKPKGVRLNIGSGMNNQEGYVNVDKYHKDADLKADGNNLDYEDNSITEVLSEHMLEHVSHIDTDSYLKEWHRVLKQQGVLRLNLPDLEWCMSEWSNPNNETFLSLHRLFGSQHEDGQVHYTGFTEDTIRTDLVNAGFQIKSIDKEWSDKYNQQCLIIEAIKSNNKVIEDKKQNITSDDEIFIIGCYANDEERIEILINKINDIKKHNLPIMIVSHYPVPTKIQDMVDYYVYEKENVLSGDWKLNYWFLIPEKLKIIGKCANGNYQSVAIISSLKNAMGLASSFYKFAHYIESDTDIDIEKYLKIVRENRDKKFVSFMYDEFKAISEEGHISESLSVGTVTNIMSFNINWFNNKLPRIRSWEQYEEYGRELPDLTFEKWVYDLIIRDVIDTDCHIIPSELKDELIINRNLIDQGSSEPKYKALLSETDTHELILFLVNETDNDMNYMVEEVEPDSQKITGVLKGHDAEWLTMEKRKSSFKVSFDGELSEVFNTCVKETYDENKFKFYDESIKCIKWDEKVDEPKEESKEKKEPEINIHFIDEPTVTISNVDANFDVQFIDKKDQRLVHTDNLDVKENISVWVKCSRLWFTDWNIKIINNGDITHDYHIDLENKNVMIHFGSKSLGDTIAWFPYVQEFKDKHNCNVHISTFWNKLFEQQYPELNFISPGTVVDDLYAAYSIGCEDGQDEVRNENNWKTQPLQKVCSDILGLEYKEIKPRISIPELPKAINYRYVCISEHSTMACKYWHYPHAWQSVVDWLESHGYFVAVISKEKTELKNVIDLTNKSIEQTMNTIKHSDLCISVSSGVAWLSWALGVKSMIISGCTKPYCEFTTDVIRIHNDKVCNGCLNDPDVRFNKGDWNWCERDKDFECSKSISPIAVTDEIAKHLNLGGLNGKEQQKQNKKSAGWKKATVG